MSKAKKAMTCFGISVMYILMYLIVRGLVSSTVYEYFTKVSKTFTGMSPQEIVAGMSVPNLLIGDGVIIVSVLLLMLLTKDNKIVGDVSKLSQMFSYISLALVVSMCASIFVSLVVSNGGSDISNETSQQVIIAGAFPVWMNIVAAGIVAPIAEELVYRYGVQRTLLKCMNPKLAVFITSFLFGFMHMALVQSIYAFIIGIVLGWCNYKKNSIVPSMIMHVAINLTSVVLALLSINSALVMVWLICTFYLCAFVCAFIERVRRK